WVVPEDLKTQIPTRQGKHLFEGGNDQQLLVLAKKRGVEELTKVRYEHFRHEMQLINRAYYQVMTERDASGQPFTYPILTENITESFYWYAPTTDILFETSPEIGATYYQDFTRSQYIINDKGVRVPNPEAYAPNAVRSM